MLPWILLTAAGLAGLLVAEARGIPRLAFVCKTLASTGFVGAALAAGALGTAYGGAVLAALVLSWIGDVLLLSKRSGPFLGGLASFLLGHIAFGIAFVLRGTDHLWALAALAILIIPALIVDRWLRPHVPADMKIPVRAYIVVISGMLALAIGTMGAGATPDESLGMHVELRPGKALSQIGDPPAVEEADWPAGRARSDRPGHS